MPIICEKGYTDNLYYSLYIRNHNERKLLYTLNTSNVALIGNGSPPCDFFSSTNSAGVISPGPSKGNSKFKKWPV